MPTPVRIGAVMAILALLVPSAALAQSDGGGGAGDSQYQDPFGSSQPSKPAKPAARQQPARQQTSPQPAPAPAAPAPAATTPAAQAQAPSAQQSPPGPTLPRTGFDVLPVAAAGVVLLLGGLALRRRPHGHQ
jgi:LPXTG-motif cell wall-anchored protein